MSQYIRILEQSVADKIAAGEVVERPASVVKELVENAIDAQCGKVRIEIKGGGQELIRVSDDGTGMSREDAQLAFKRHATSKISTEQDLEAIESMGFRGEALPSIAAVSMMELSTKDEHSATGTFVEMVAGEPREIVEVGRPGGTSVTVKKLFYNTPARRKFLRSPQSEYRRIVDLVNNLALAHCHIAFQLVHNGRETLNLPAVQSLNDRLFYLWPKDVVEDLHFFSESSPHMHVEGYVGTPEAARANRQHQLFILNKRPVTDKSLSHGLFQAYQSIFPKDRHPSSVILIGMDANLVDVNVHPAKKEVRFRDARAVHDLVAYAVGKALSQLTPLTQLREEFTAAGDRRPGSRGRLRESAAVYSASDVPDEFIQETMFDAPSEDEVLPVSGVGSGRGDLISLWQLHNLYIFAAIKSGLVIIDQHAAHERVLYERAKRSFRESTGATQQLLFPQVIELSQSELQVFDEHQDLLSKLGFSARAFGGKTVLVEAEPAILKGSGNAQVLRGILDELATHKFAELEREERLARSFACKGAVKAGDRLTQEEMNSLVNMLFATSAPYTCPHGRPTVIRMSLDELGRKFGR